MEKINLEKARKLVNNCEYCDTITEIVTAIERYNIINGTNYKLDVKYRLYTTNNCGICALTKNLIRSQNLKIQIVQTESDHMEYLRKNKVNSFPVLEIKSGEKLEFIDGKNVGGFIATNLEMFK